VDGEIRALFLFKERAHYKPLYDMQGVRQRVIEAEFDRQFAAQMDYALSTTKVRLFPPLRLWLPGSNLIQSRLYGVNFDFSLQFVEGFGIILAPALVDLT
jgi:hypothetical protein